MKRKKIDNTPKITALYERLSREDDGMGESGSITNQKKKLEAYVAEQGFTNPVHYTDDGYSGSSFNRPAWKQLMEDVDAGKIGTIIAKDMSRIGRNYLEVGHYTEIVLPQKGVRFIAIDNGVDSNDPSTSEFAPILNLVNEWYVKDHSEKVRMSYRARSYAGEHTASCPLYGYKKDPDQKGHWIIDEEAAEVVRYIFSLALEEKTPGQIATILFENRVEKPSCRLARLYPNRKMPDNPYGWLASTVSTYLSSEEYMGTTINFKTHKPSYKSKKEVKNSREQMEVMEATQAAIIEPDVWYRVQEVQRELRERKGKAVPIEGWTPLKGYVFCADCGAAMCNVRSRSYPRKNGKGKLTGGRTKPLDLFNCKTHLNSQKRHQNCCSQHTVHTSALTELTLEALRQVAQEAFCDEQGFLANIKSENARQWQSETRREVNRSLSEKQKRCAELDELIQGAYEANFKGKLTDERLSILVSRYETEQEPLMKEIADLEKQIRKWQETQKDGRAFMSRLKQIADFSTLTAEICSLFLERIVVHERVRQGDEISQEIEIYFKFIGKVV